MDFRSDNVATVADEIIQAIVDSNVGTASAYGDDKITKDLEVTYSELFETPVKIFPVVTGTVANALALSVLCPPYGIIYAESRAHVHNDECGAPELFSGGAKIMPISGIDGKITGEQFETVISSSPKGFVHSAQPAVLSITQSTESGTVYSVDDIKELCRLAAEFDLSVHMDGARFANAVASLEDQDPNVSLADITWRSGVDILSFGATKNGTLGAEAVIVFDSGLANEMAFRHKRAGQLASKMRYISVQLEAYVKNDLWLCMARHANSMCKSLASKLKDVPGIEIVCWGHANELFLKLRSDTIVQLRQEGFQFYDWPEGTRSESSHLHTVRLVTRHDMKISEVDEFVSAVIKYNGKLMEV